MIMHSFDAPSGHTYHHSGDFSGDVKFDVPQDKAQVGPDGTVFVSVPMADLVALVATMLRRQMISRLEDMPDDELIKNLKLI